MRKAKAMTLVIILDATLSECFASLPENEQVDEQYKTNNWHDFPEKNADNSIIRQKFSLYICTFRRKQLYLPTNDGYGRNLFSIQFTEHDLCWL